MVSKILSLPELLELRGQLRSEGTRLVQCHGCFDIVHPGHIRHLRQARTLGDRLLVSITGDSGINKGLGRPLIPQELRAENLAALDCVDYVYVDTAPTALELLTAVEPDVYVKGKEYENNNDPRFAAERASVERAGGRVVFSSGDIVFSSTALISALEHSSESPYQQRLSELSRDPRIAHDAIGSLLSTFAGKRITVIGESIIDTYIMCAQPRIASESPVMTLRPIEARQYDGGAAIVAKHCAAMGAIVTLVTPVSSTTDAQTLEFTSRLASAGINVVPIECGSPLPEKQRFLVGTQKMMKLDLIQQIVLDARQQTEFIETATRAARTHSDAAIITDFNLGLFSTKLVRRLCAALRPHVRTLSGDVSGSQASLRAFVDVDLLTPSENELRDSMQLASEGLPLVVDRLMSSNRARNIIVTLGADGLIAFAPAPGCHKLTHDGALPRDVNTVNQDSWTTRLTSEHIPALTSIATDPLGCGDSLLAAATLALSSGADVTTAAYVGSLAASVQVQQLGNLPVTISDMRRQLNLMRGAHLTLTTRDTPVRLSA
jgi:rfaE bifunctional protein nucleotidyltransferase chain/domain